MSNKLHKDIGLLGKLYGDGSMELNVAEKKYSSYGPMKMAGIANHNLNKGDIFSKKDFNFRRTSQISDISQVELLQLIGSRLEANIDAHKVILSNHFKK